MINEKIKLPTLFSNNAIKIIAIATMFVDHFSKIVISWFLAFKLTPLAEAGQFSAQILSLANAFTKTILYGIGTMSFPLFCFLISEGIHHTKNMRKYITRLGLFALISEIPYDTAFFSVLSKNAGTFPLWNGHQNVFFTLFLGAIALLCYKKLNTNSENIFKKTVSVLLQILSICIIAIIAHYLHTDYGYKGILYMAAFYIFRKNKLLSVAAFLIAYTITRHALPTVFTLLSCIIILMYNGKRGKLNIKYFSYAFYPVHLAILAVFINLVL